MYVDNVLIDSVEMLPLPSDSRYMQALLRKLLHKHRSHPELEEAEFLIEGVTSGMNTPRQYAQKLEGYLGSLRSGSGRRRKKPL
jgi:hypothetical protein